jgi:hypothetical protein
MAKDITTLEIVLVKFRDKKPVIFVVERESYKSQKMKIRSLIIGTIVDDFRNQKNYIFVFFILGRYLVRLP